jgi:radical SAM protein (TIGR01212 family)
MFPYTLDNKRYHTLNYHVKNKYKTKVVKVSLNAGFSCPNIDGTVGYGGCIYCSKSGSGEFGGDINKSLPEQFYEIKEKIAKKWPNSKYIAYFQARTNTYAPLEILKQKYESVLNLEDVIGIAIATRCDAITDEVLDYLTELNKQTNLTIELGLQTIHEETSKLINRCHTLNQFEKMVKKLQERNIEVVAHIINGLPYETKEMMIETAKYLNRLNINGIKIHMLNITKNTPLALLYKEKPFKVLTKEEYIDIVIKQLEYLNPNIVIHRITSDPDPKELIEPSWLLKKFCVLNDIDKEMKKRNTYQGIKTGDTN